MLFHDDDTNAQAHINARTVVLSQHDDEDDDDDDTNDGKKSNVAHGGKANLMHPTKV